MINLLVVDDQRLVRKCLVASLAAVEDFAVVAEADCGESARRMAREHDIDVVLMDLNMPGIGGLEAARGLLTAQPDVRIIGLSMYVDGPYPRRFMELGGAGYVSKNADADELVKSIRTVHAGGFFISHDVAQQIAAQDLIYGASHSVSELTRRELQVLQQVSEGGSIEVIAARMCLSPKTIAHHRRRLLSKLGCENDVQLAIVARSQGLTDLGEALFDRSALNDSARSA